MSIESTFFPRTILTSEATKCTTEALHKLTYSEKWNEKLIEAKLTVKWGKREDLDEGPKALTATRWRDRMMKQSTDVWYEGSSIRDYFKPALQSLVRQILNSLAFSPEATLLELGSDHIEGGHSYLSSLMPPHLQENVTFSDFLPNVVAKESKKTSRPYLRINAKKITNSVAPNSLEGILSLSTMDVLERKKIQKVAKSAFCALKNEGYFIIFNDRMIYPLSLLEKHTTPETFATFWFELNSNDDYCLKGIKYVSRELIQEKYKKLSEHLLSSQRLFFDTFFSLDLPEFVTFLHNMHLESFYDFFNCLDEIFPTEGVTYLDQEETYSLDMQSSLRAEGFRILSVNKIRSGVIVPSFTEDCNSAEYNMGWITYAKDPALDVPLGQMMVYSNLLAIVAKKA